MPNIERLQHQEAHVAAEIHAVFELAHTQESNLLGVAQSDPKVRTPRAIQESPAFFIGAYFGGALAGVVSVSPDDEPSQLCIAFLAVRPEFQRLGIGKQLVSAVLARGRGVRFSVVTAAKNLPALALYRALGFAQYRCGTMGEAGLPMVKLRSAV